MNSKTKRITHKILAWILAVLTVLSSMTLMFPTIAEAATTSKIVSYWPSGGYSHHRFVVNGKDAFCINYGNASTGSFKKTSKTKSYYNKLGSGKQNKINQILTYAAKRGYLNYSGGGTITVSGNKLQKKDVYYSAIQRAIWQITDKSAANNGLSKWYKSVTKSAYNDIMNNYSKMLTADDVPSFKTPTLKESGHWGATVKDRNGILNSTDWKITSYSGLKSASISGSSLKVYAKDYFSGNKTVKLASKYKVYDLDSSYAGIFGSQYAIMTAGGNKTLNASMSVKAQKPTPDPEPTPTQHFATIQVKKTDNTGKVLQGVKFKLTYTDQDKIKYTQIKTTNSSGIAFFDNDGDKFNVYKNDKENNGNPSTKIQYTLEEISSPDDYFVIPGTSKQTFTLSTGQTYNAKTPGYSTWVNIPKLGDLKVVKYAENTAGSYDFGKDFTFKIVNTTTKKEYTSTTNANGEAYFCNVPVGEYTLSEVNKAAYIPAEAQTIDVDWDGNTSMSNREFSTDPSQYTESKTLKYTDAGMPEFNGDGVLPDVVPDYGEDEDLGDQSDVEDKTFDYNITGGTMILHLHDEIGQPIADAEFVLIASDGSELTTFTTDANGQATVAGLYGGEYSVRQKTTRDDCFIDINAYDFTIEVNNDTKELYLINEISDQEPDVDPDEPEGIPANAYTFYNNVKRGDLQVVKTEEVLGQNPLEQGTTQKGVGYKFTVTSAAEDNSLGVKLVYTVTTGADGKAALYDIPVGKYTVSEIETPNKFVKPADAVVTVTWDNQKSYTVAGSEKFNVGDASLQAETLVTVNMKNTLDRVSVSGHKVDENGKIIQGAVFGIFDKSATEFTKENALATSITDENGDFLFTNVPHGTYQVVELSCPEGYCFTQEPQQVIADGSERVIYLTFVNETAKGQINITKIGEGFTSVTEDGDIYVPVYDTVGLQNVTFGIYAVEDIVAPDGTVVYKSGELVEKIVTGEGGLAATSKLPLGTYQVVELETNPGYQLKTDPITVTLAYKDATTPLVLQTITVVNQRQKLHVDLTKAMEADEDFNIGNNGELQDVVFGLYSKDEITAADGSVIPADGLLGTATPDENGQINFDVDVPYGHDYYVKEISTNEKYVLDDGTYDVSFNDVSATDASMTANSNTNFEEGKLVNHIIRGTIVITKTDVSTGKVIPNCKIEILDADKNVVAQGTTDVNGQVAFVLPYGDYYYREYKAPKGYILDTTPHKFSIKENGEVLQATMTNEAEVIHKKKTGMSFVDMLAPSGVAALGIGIYLLMNRKRKIS